MMCRLHADMSRLAAAGYNLQALGILAQLVALGSRIACMKTSTEFIKDKRAATSPPVAATSGKKTK